MLRPGRVYLECPVDSLVKRRKKLCGHSFLNSYVTLVICHAMNSRFESLLERLVLAANAQAPVASSARLPHRQRVVLVAGQVLV